MTSSRTRTMYLAVSPACIQLIYVMNVVVRGQGCGCDSHSAYTSPLTSPVSGTLWKNRQMNIVNRTVIRRRATSRREREEHRLGWRAPRLRPQSRLHIWSCLAQRYGCPLARVRVCNHLIWCRYVAPRRMQCARLALRAVKNTSSTVT